MPMVVWVVLGGLLYGLSWTNLFRPLRSDTVLFLVFTSLVFLILAATVSTPTDRSPAAPVQLGTVLAITVYYALAYIVNGGIPILLVLRGEAYDVYGFGIEGLHVFFLCLTGYYALRLFRVAITRGGRWVWIGWIWLVLLVVSIGSRSALSFLVFACAVLFTRRYRLSPRSSFLAILLGVGFVVFFTGFGDARLGFQIEQATGGQASSLAILSLSDATQQFSETGLPPSLLWLYMYFVSPIANLNEAFAFSEGHLCGDACNIAGLVVHEFLPDAIGERLAEAFSVVGFDKSHFLIAPNLTAATGFGSAVGYAGLVGAVSLLGWAVLMFTLARRAIAGTVVYEEGMAVLATVVFFFFFENMIAYSALSLQLVLVMIRARTGVRWL